MKTITTIVMIGKSKKEIAYTFKAENFIRIEGDRLYLKEEERKLIIAPDFIKQTIVLINEN
jgi:hypothetical protein